MQEYLEKVTAFVTRPGPIGPELLLFAHLYAGNQIPAGTVEEGEAPEQAVLREVAEETGLSALRLQAQIGRRDELPHAATHVVARSATLYARPDAASFDWARLPRGTGVRLLRRAAGFAQVSYEENDSYPQAAYISYQLTGWLSEDALALTNRRSFFHLQALDGAPELHPVFTDHHTFRPFWAPLSRLPEIVAPQQAWLDFVQADLGYDFGSSLNPFFRQ